jgi:hypothetical protein
MFRGRVWGVGGSQVHLAGDHAVSFGWRGLQCWGIWADDWFGSGEDRGIHEAIPIYRGSVLQRSRGRVQRHDSPAGKKKRKNGKRHLVVGGLKGVVATRRTKMRMKRVMN